MPARDRRSRSFPALSSGRRHAVGRSRPSHAVEALEARQLLSGAPPVGVEDYYAVVAAQQLVVPAPGVLANDSDAEEDPITATEFTNPTSGAITVLTDDGSFTYDPDPLFLGMSQFTYLPSDGVGGAPVTVRIAVYPPGDSLPVVEDNSYPVVEDQPLTVGLGDNVLTNDVDADGDALSATLHRGPEHGELTFNGDGTFTYTPDANFSGQDSFVYVAWSLVDSNLLASPDLGTVTLVVAAADDPIAVVLPPAQTTAEDTPLALDGEDAIRVADPDLSPDSVVRVELAATNGLMSLAGPNPGVTIDVGDGVLDAALTITGELAAVNDFLATLSFAPAATFVGQAGIEVTASVVGEVGEGSTDTASLAITVTALNDAPTALPESYVAIRGLTLEIPADGGVLANDSDVDAMALSAVLEAGPQHGTLDLFANGGFTYTPAAGFVGADSFTYRASDGEAQSEPVTVSIQVNAPAGLARLVENPFDAEVEDLVVEGTGGPDEILVVDRRDGSFNVTLNGSFLGKFRPTGKVVVKALGGHDRVTTASVLGGALVYGGSGRDTLIGGSGADLFVGGDGHDTIDGGAGRNLLIGGEGGDAITTRTLGSILVGQATRYDAAASAAGRAALEALLAAWTSGASFHSRVSLVRTQGVTTAAGGRARFTSASLIADEDVNTFAHSPVADLLIGIEGDEFNATAADALRLF